MHYSITEINTYLQCPEKWYCRYVERIKRPIPAAVARGRMYDAILNKILTIKDDEAVNLKEIAISSIEDDEIAFDFAKENGIDELAETAINAAMTYVTEGLPYISQYQKRVQDRFEIKFDKKNWSFMGYMDVVIDTEDYIIDNKLLSRTPSQNDVDRDLQLTAYSLGYLKKYGKMPKKLSIDAVVLNKKPKFIRIETQRSERDVERFLKILDAVVNSIEKAVIYPRQGWHCTNCEYVEECKTRW